MPSLTDFAFLLPLAFLFGRMDGLKTLLGDCDTGWHIRTGEWITANHWVPTHDIFSYSKAGNPWFAWEWLSDVIFAWLNAHGGLRLVALFAILLLCATFTLLYGLVRRRAGHIVAILITMTAMVASSIHWLARPHLFTLLFTVLFCRALDSVRTGRTRLAGVPYLAILPAATVLWTNLHAGFFVGILLIFAYGGAELLEFFLAAEETVRRRAQTNGRRYFLSGLACLAASLVNPYTYHLHVHMIEYLRDPSIGQYVAEFLSISFHHPIAPFFEILLALGAVAAYEDLRRGRLAEPMLLVVWAHGALVAARNIPIFAIVAAPMAAEQVERMVAGAAGWQVASWARRVVMRFDRLAAATAESEAVGRWHLASVLGVAAVVAVIWSPNPPKKFRAEFDPGFYPARALAELRSRPSSHIFTNDEWGDYLIWSLYPSGRVFIDGRSDFYGKDFNRRYIDVINVKDGWDKTLSRFGVDTILMPPDAPLAGALKESSRWKAVYDDGVAVIFRPSGNAGGESLSAAACRGGGSRDREVTKTGAGSETDPTRSKTRS